MRTAHIGVSVANIDRSIRWYRNVLGVAVTKQFEKQEFQIKGASLTNGQITIELIQPRHLKNKPPLADTLAEILQDQGLNHIAFSVDDIDACYKTIDASEGQCLTPVIAGRFFFCCDPDGSLMEIKTSS